MIQLLRDFRLIPVVLVAIAGLFALKAIGLVFDGGYTLGQRLGRSDTLTVTTVPATSASTPLRSQTTALEMPGTQPANKLSWMQEMFQYPDITGSVANSRANSARDAAIVTGSTPAAKPAAGETASKDSKDKPQTKPAAPPPAPQGTVINMDPSRPASPAERAILERLQERRQELDARAREYEIRDGLLKADEKKLEARLEELKALEARLGSGQRKDEMDANRFKGLVTMYESMKPKDAAKIFDRLEMRVLIEVVSQINPRQMSVILAQMTPEAAEKLTVELATRAGGDKTNSASDLPKIEGKPSGS